MIVLGLNTLFCSIIFIPFILLSGRTNSPLQDTIFFVPIGTVHDHLMIMVKAVIVLSSWAISYYGLKQIPLTIAGPINATRPVIVLIGALTIFGERLNIYQWLGVIIALVSFFMLSIAGKKEGINFYHNKWIYCCVAGMILGAISGLYDKYLLLDMNPMFVQSWFLLYQCIIMIIVISLMLLSKKENRTPFHWSWAILLISFALCTADFFYFYSLSLEDSMISIVSMLRRSSVVVSFFYGALILKEKNIRDKAIDLMLVLIGLCCLVFGSLQ